ncbi:ornithine cyclodeaminase family protein [Sphingomonas profundi]|uniref:ornithine cyclodeaminase family protein n=1 Tax=Alterirhizorhabdus profundi TaxID=2681549 RepID=UPI0012E9211B|nr:ornithine cyclodeaminase family protein [Sphingomonas profundi]
MSVELRILNAADVRELLPMSDCIELMAPTMIAVSAGNAVLPLRSIMSMPGDIGALGIMPGYLASAGMYATKLISLFPRNAGSDHSSHIGMLVLFETGHGYSVGILDAAEVTAIRTAAASALATRLLARADASILAILGTGEQAARHLEAMLVVRQVKEVRLWGRNSAKAERLADVLRDRHQVAVRAVADVKDAVDGVDIVCTTTHAAEPILLGEWIGPGTHLDIVGSSIPTTAEIDGVLVAKARFFGDYRNSTRNQAGEFLRAIDAGLITADHLLGEIGEVASGAIQGRLSDRDITLYKSLGIAAQDVAAGRFVLDRAKQLKVGG